MKEPLKQVIRNHYDSASLSEDQLAKLQALQRAAAASTPNESTEPAGASPGNPSARRRSTTWRFGMVAAILVFLLAAVGYLSLRRTAEREALVQSIVAEVAANHLKESSQEEPLETLVAVRHKLEELPFFLIASRHMPESKWAFSSGKYCSIQGQIAAQLHYAPIDRPENRFTLYQTLCPETLVGGRAIGDLSEPRILHHAGLELTLWRERDLLLVLAGAESPR